MSRRNKIENFKKSLLKEKKCFTCGVVKKREEFEVRTELKGGLHGSCKVCLKKRKIKAM